MALPRKLKHLNLFNDGNNWQGIVESLTLPKFTRKFEKYRGGGMPGAVDIDLGLDDGALDTEFSIGGTELLLFKQMGAATVDGIQLRFTGSIQRDDTGEVQAVELVVRGRHKELDSGEWKTGESNTTKVSSTNSYAKLTINGEVLYEVDLVNMVEIVGGTDLMEAIMDMDVGAMMTVIPRISTPTLTAQEMAELDPADLTALSVEVVTFLLKKSVLAGLPTA